MSPSPVTRPSTRRRTASTARSRCSTRSTGARPTTARAPPCVATVHYEERYVNAFWDGAQLVFGDGDGEIFDRFTKPVDVVGPRADARADRAHGRAGLRGPVGCAQRVGLRRVRRVPRAAAARAERRRGGLADRVGPVPAGVQARGLRDMAAPGTAYDDPVLGRDPQPAHMDDYVDTVDDNGGVHLNSGIPNRAFHLAATAIGGSSAEGAGADLVRRAHRRPGRGPDRLRRVRGGHRRGGRRARRRGARGVGDGRRHAGRVVRRARSAVPARRKRVAPRPGPPLRRLPRPDLSGRGGPRPRRPRAGELAALVDRVDLATVPGGVPKPDMYVYDFDLCGSTATVPEHHLTRDLRRIADLVLDAWAGRGRRR